MGILSIVQLKKGQYDFCGSCLRMHAEPVDCDDFGKEWLIDLVSDMFETLYSCPSGVGLAANQVGILKKICVIDLKRDAQNPLVLINPSYTPVSNETVTSQEVCLSFPLVSVSVQRYKKINVKYNDIWGNDLELVAEGFKSNVLQHEIDHLYGQPHIDQARSENLTEYIGGSAKNATKAMSKILNKEGEK